MTKTRFLTILFLAMLMVWGCNRKDDEALPERIGDLLVRFTLHDESDLLEDPSSIPVIVSLYLDTLHTRLVASQDLTVAADVQQQLLFEELPVEFYWLEILVNESGLPPKCPDTRVFVQQNLTTPTGNLVYTLRSDSWDCPILTP